MRIDDFVKNLGISDHPGFRLDQNLSGYRDYTFGCRAGPGRKNLLDLSHELAHAAQFGPRYFRYRAAEYGFVFRVRKVYLLGLYYDDPMTPQATIRELDTFAYQAHLLEFAGIKVNRNHLFQYAARILTMFMSDSAFVPGADDAQRKLWCEQKAQELYARRKQATVLRRLNGWLDETAKRLSEYDMTPQNLVTHNKVVK